MTKRLTSALLCAAILLALGGAATAEAKPLSYRTAKALAKRLAQRQVHGRSVVSWHLLTSQRVGPNRIVFAYDDRTTANVFCRARLIVSSSTRGRTTTTRARFAGQRCAGIPSEVLQFEALTRSAQRELRANTAETVDRLDAVRRAVRTCRAVRVPRSKRHDAQALFDIATVEALEQPNDAAVGTFVASLADVDASNATLAAGAAGWADYLAIIRSLPQVDSPCGLLKSWASAGYTAASAPIDFAEFRRLDRRSSVDEGVIDKAATLMAERGAFPNAVIGFTPGGLLTQASVKTGITGGAGKLGKIRLG
jgi:hypothetical protein